MVDNGPWEGRWHPTHKRASNNDYLGRKYMHTYNDQTGRWPNFPFKWKSRCDGDLNYPSSGLGLRHTYVDPWYTSYDDYNYLRAHQLYSDKRIGRSLHETMTLPSRAAGSFTNGIRPRRAYRGRERFSPMMDRYNWPCTEDPRVVNCFQRRFPDYVKARKYLYDDRGKHGRGIRGKYGYDDDESEWLLRGPWSLEIDDPYYGYGSDSSGYSDSSW